MAMAADITMPNNLRIFNFFWRHSSLQEAHIAAIYSFLNQNLSLPTNHGGASEVTLSRKSQQYAQINSGYGTVYAYLVIHAAFFKTKKNFDHF